MVWVSVKSICIAVIVMFHVPVDIHVCLVVNVFTKLDKPVIIDVPLEYTN